MKLGNCEKRIFRINNIKFSPKYMLVQAVLMEEDGYYSRILVYTTDRAVGSEPMLILPFHKNQATDFCCMAISLDERYLAAGSSDGEITVWDLENPQEPLKLTTDHGRPHQDRVLSLAFGKNGELASASADMMVRLWKLNENKSWIEIKIKLIDNNLSFNNAIKALPSVMMATNSRPVQVIGGSRYLNLILRVEICIWSMSSAIPPALMTWPSALMTKNLPSPVMTIAGISTCWIFKISLTKPKKN